MKELLIYALEVLVCSAALLLAYSVLLERRTAFLHCRLYLIGAMLLAALIPALSIPVWTGETLYMAADPVAAAAPTAAPAAADAGTPSLPVAVTLFLYTLGVLLSFGAMIAQIVRIRRLRHGARTIRRADCDIVLTQADISSFSFFRTVYLHDAIPESDMAAVVAHELSHIRHRHSTERIVMECIRALLWWNPFVRIAARRLAEVEEYEADRDVLTQGYDPSEYIATIFKTQFGYSPDIANGLRDSLTKKRFQMMTKHSGDSRALLRLAGSIPVVLLLLACFSFTSQATEIRTDPPNGQSDSDIEIVIHLEPWQDGKFYDRLGLEGDTYTILGVQLPYVTIPVRPGRNLAGIVEIAAMKNRQMRYGYNSARDFMTQFDKKMDELARQAKEKQ